MYGLALAALAVVLIALAPRVMARRVGFRRAPMPALLAWQAVALAGVAAALAAAPVAVAELGPANGTFRPAADVLAVAVSGLVLISLLVNGHLVGTRLRAARRRHRELIELVGRDEVLAGGGYRVLPHETPTVYCVPGRRGRVVLTDGTLSRLSAPELQAVLEHERTHLHQRHDLVLEFFSVLHRAAPPPIRAPQALREVELLIEVLADRAARRDVGTVPLARALVALAQAPSSDAGDEHAPSGDTERRGVASGTETPTAALPGTPTAAPPGTPRPASGDGATITRMRLLTASASPRGLDALMYAFSVAVLAAPAVLIALAIAA
ncbi:M56 family metallopeptidase [Cumulibacter soli]|uniref:M56 family metallopeptidase n=1 Tax=Cumulibacter soli TaxID=2546344 RepID=UPI00106835BE|nr:M56 family metallopeptidase [Cumulibacter soli]